MNRFVTGHSSYKHDLLLQFAAEDFADGITIIDPTGTLARAAANILPARLTQRALYFDPSNMARPIGLNVLEHVPLDERQRLTEELCAYFEAMWPNGWGAQSNFLLANCLRLLLDNNQTMLGIIKLLNEPSFSVSLTTADPIVSLNWDLINSWERKQRQQALAPLQNKIGTLLMSPMIRNIVGQQKTTLNQADIIIANLDRSKLGDTTARLLGGLLLARSEGHVIVNDYAFFGASLPFPQERFTVAIDFLDQLDPKTREAVLAIEEKYVFRTNKRDAQELHFYVDAPNPRKLTELDTATVISTRYQPYTPEAPASRKRLKALKERTRACHTRDRVGVELEIGRYLRCNSLSAA
jgi:hypothetical protein